MKAIAAALLILCALLTACTQVKISGSNDCPATSGAGGQAAPGAAGGEGGTGTATGGTGGSGAGGGGGTSGDAGTNCTNNTNVTVTEEERQSAALAFGGGRLVD